jgi:RNA polymerase sigma-70 factor (ECF subfamily)
MNARFATTNWSMVLAAGETGSAQAREALAALCEDYWYPVYAFTRRQGASAEDARDLTQGYFLQLLEKGYLKGLTPEAGRFRSFLLVSVKHFLSNARDRERALKRGGGRPPLSLDYETAEGRYRFEAADPAPTPERLFERRWALTVLENTMGMLRQEFERAGASPRYERLRAYLTEDGAQTPYGEAAKELGMSETAVKVTVHRMRQRFGRALREIVARTVATPGEVDDEIRSLLAALGT